MMAMSANSTACTTGLTAALIARDINAALALLTDDVVFLYSNGAAIRGKEAFAATMTASWKIIEGYKYETLESVLGFAVRGRRGRHLQLCVVGNSPRSSCQRRWARNAGVSQVA